MPDTYSLGEIEQAAVQHGATHINIRCRRCSRHGRLSLARLVDEHGTDMPGPALLRLLIGDCPKRDAVALHERCSPFGVELVQWMMGRKT